MVRDEGEWGEVGEWEEGVVEMGGRRDGEKGRGKEREESHLSRLFFSFSPLPLPPITLMGEGGN